MQGKIRNSGTQEKKWREIGFVSPRTAECREAQPVRGEVSGSE